MRIWLVQTGEALPIRNDVRKLRTSILADKLVEKGHSVVWWASAFDHFKKDWYFKYDTELDLNKSLKIKTLKGIGYKRNISMSRFIDHRIIARKFKNRADKISKPDIIIAATPSYDIAYEAVVFAKNNKIPVLVDIRDQWPDIFITHFSPMLKKYARLFLSRDFKMFEKTVGMADGLVAMMNTLLEWGLKYANRERTEKDRVFYLGCSGIPEDYHRKKSILKSFPQLENKFVVTFVGTFGYYHDPRVLIECAEKVAKDDIYFVLAGDGESFKEIKEKSKNLSNVILTGWLNQDGITDLLCHSNVGICPTTKQADFFPNKAFSYFSAGIPVISAFEGDLKEIIKKYEVGFYYPPNDTNALLSHIRKLHDDALLYKKVSENAYRIFSQMFDADNIYEEYAEYVVNFAKQYNDQKRYG